ncbi:MAG: hypothetical protein QOH84_5211, partial [Kribbellaceae bacterium]|nr:hypothetical protein [Kribbellaceae bacterium]
MVEHQAGRADRTDIRAERSTGDDERVDGAHE